MMSHALIDMLILKAPHLVEAPADHPKGIGVIFDMDGVLVNSEEAHFMSWQQALRKCGVVDFQEDEYFEYVGHAAAYNAQALAARYAVGASTAILHAKTEHYNELHQRGLPPVEGVVAFVQALSTMKQSHSIKLGVASSAKRHDILFTLKKIGLNDAFDVVVSGADDLASYHDPEGTNKPKPYVYLEAARQLGLPPARCIAFEDSSIGVAAAAAAGVYTYAVPHKYTCRHDFSKANRVLPSFLA